MLAKMNDFVVHLCGISVTIMSKSSSNTIDLEVQLKNAIFKELLQVHHGGGVAQIVPAPPLHRKEPLDFIRLVQEDWESMVRRGINTLCTERGIPLAREVRWIDSLQNTV